MDKHRPITETFHSVDILVHPFTAKDDFLKFSRISALDEYQFYFNELQLDGIFTENPKTAILAREYFSYFPKEETMVYSKFV